MNNINPDTVTEKSYLIQFNNDKTKVINFCIIDSNEVISTNEKFQTYNNKEDFIKTLLEFNIDYLNLK
jgi:hypothetical protein